MKKDIWSKHNPNLQRKEIFKLLGGLLFKIGGFYLPFLVCGTLLVLAGVMASFLLLIKVT
jgi:hypothetical protein